MSVIDSPFRSSPPLGEPIAASGTIRQVLLVTTSQEFFQNIEELVDALPNKVFALHRAASYEEALGSLDAYCYDAYLIDVGLGSTYGLDWLRLAVERNCRAPLILLDNRPSPGNGSNHRREPDIAVESLRIGAADYLVRDELTPPLLDRSLRYAIERTEALNILRRRDHIRQVINTSAKSFLNTTDWQSNIMTFLAQLGEAAEVSRVFIFDVYEEDNTVAASQRYEWSAPGITPQLGSPLLQNLALHSAGFIPFTRNLQMGEAQQAHVRELPQPERELLQLHDVRSLVVVPIFIGQRWWGFMGFAECQREKEWNEAELSILHVAADFLGAGIERAQREEELQESLQFNREIISSAGEGIVVYDQELRYLVWNPFMEKLTGLKANHVIGRHAIEVLPQMVESGIEVLLERALHGDTSQASEMAFYIPHTDKSGWISSTYEPHRNARGEIIGVIGMIHDITQRKRAESAVRQSEEKFRSLIENGLDIITVFNSDGTIRYGSPSLERILGYKPGDLVDQNVFIYVHDDDLDNAQTEMLHLIDTPGATASLELRLRHYDGSWRHFEARIRNLLDDPIVAGVVANSRDVTQRKEVEELLVHNAFHDQLTDLPNRALFMDRLGQFIERARRNRRGLFAVLFLDFDRFKIINDSLGHMIGDELLIGIARRLEGCVRPGDTVARLGGDEFSILLDEINSVADATQAAERILEELERPFSLQRQEIYITASIGIALGGGDEFAPEHITPEDVLRNADMAMYRAKEMGRARHEIFDTGMHAQAVTRLELETDIRHAIDAARAGQPEFRLQYQPIVSLRTGRISSFEALVRWHHPKRGLISPLNFIPVAEDTGYIVAIGWWVLREACRQMRLWLDELGQDNDYFDRSPLAVGVNLSSKQFSQPDLVSEIEKVIRDANLEPHHIKLEITESTLMDVETATNQLLQLRALGVQLGVDDFGTGYSSLSYLHRFPIDALKIDRSFVSRMNDEGNLEIVRTIISLAENLNMVTIAEGVETISQLQQLRDLGCPQAQGFYFYGPQDSTMVSRILAEKPVW